MKKLFTTVMATIMCLVFASAQTVEVVDNNDVIVATYDLDQIKQINFLPKTSYYPVDLGLSVKWASCNIGATCPEECGEYFAWGETEPKTTYSADNSKWYTIPWGTLQSDGVIDEHGNLTAQYDAASVNWGNGWRIPTLDEVRELLNNCSWTWTTIDEHKGYEVVGPNGNSIFLPIGGYRHFDDLLKGAAEGYYWTAQSYGTYYYALCFTFTSSHHEWVDTFRYNGMLIRPVKE